MVGHGQSFRKKKFGNDKFQKNGKDGNLEVKGGTFKKSFRGYCHNCDRPGHQTANYKLTKKEKEENIMKKITNDVSGIDLTMIISEVNHLDPNPREW